MNVETEARIGVAAFNLHEATRKSLGHDVEVMFAAIQQSQAARLASQVEREASR